MDNPRSRQLGKARAGERPRPLLARESVKVGRPRQINPHAPAHIDQSKLPNDVYFDHRWGGTWYVLSRVESALTDKGKPKRTRTNLAKADATLAQLHRRLEEIRATDDRGTMDWLCGLFRESEKWKTLAVTTQEDYDYCRSILAKQLDKSGLALGRWPISAFTSPVIQRLVDRIGKTHPSKANHLLRYLRRLFRWGGNRGYCSKINPAEKIEPATEVKKRTIPVPTVMRTMIEYARECGRLPTRRKGAQPPYLWAVAEIAYRCRLRGIEAVTLTDANHTPEGILTNRRKGSRDNITEWSPALRQAWDALAERRSKVWAAKGIPTPMRPEDRPLVVSEDGTPLLRRALGTAWKRLMTAAVTAGVIEAADTFGMHAFKRRGITDTKGTRDKKQEASGHKSAAMVDVYDFSVPVVKPAGE